MKTKVIIDQEYQAFYQRILESHLQVHCERERVLQEKPCFQMCLELNP
ncbi:unnamed protein product, partial [Vitis vinifera]|uniref:Uncharacterized protein n=1 Tax=Vitis vinifera TaxID=29760 RepID=D7T209_VITVI